MKTGSLWRLGLIALTLLFLIRPEAYAREGLDLMTGKKTAFATQSRLATVYVFLSARCPCSRGHERAIQALHERFSKNFEFVGIHSNQNEPMNEAREHFKKAALGFTIIEDAGAVLADEFRALKTPHVYVRQGERSLFEGGVDNTASGNTPEKRFLQNALEEIQAGRPVTLSRVRVLGCAIQRSKS